MGRARGHAAGRRRWARPLPGLAVVAVVALTLGACASLGGTSDGGVGAGSPEGDRPDATEGGDGGDGRDATDEPGGTPAVDGAPLLQVTQAGGFVMPGTDFRTPPLLTVYADGLAVTQGPQIAIYPPPALPNLQTVQLGEDDLAGLVAAAREAGLLAEAPDYGSPPVADVPATVVSLTVDGRTYVHRVDALGFEGGGGGADSGLSEENLDARAALTSVVSSAQELVGSVGETQQYAADAYAVLAQPAPPGADAAGDDGLQRQVLPWPLDVPLADLATCAVVDGDAAAGLTTTLAGANQITLFEQDGVLYDVWPRPLLPHETGCPQGT